MAATYGSNVGQLVKLRVWCTPIVIEDTGHMDPSVPAGSNPSQLTMAHWPETNEICFLRDCRFSRKRSQIFIPLMMDDNDIHGLALAASDTWPGAYERIGHVKCEMKHHNLDSPPLILSDTSKRQVITLV